MNTDSHPRDQVMTFRVPFADYIAFEALCREHNTNMNRALREYLSMTLQTRALTLPYLSNDTHRATIEPGADGEQ
jgi:hypothetical protein